MKWALLCLYDDGNGSVKVPLNLRPGWDDEDLVQVVRIIRSFATETFSNFRAENIHIILDEEQGA